MKNFVVSIVMLGALIAAPESGATEAEQRAVLITGASTGIGRQTAEQLAAAGYFVYAGARKDKDLAALNEIDNVMAVRLDVTRQDEIDAAVRLIEAQGRGLWGLVNNAGINTIDPLIEADVGDLEFLFDVNVYGVFRVTKAFAPMIIDSQGRIVNISSIAGILSGGLPGYGMYVMSKHAVEAYSDQLAFEMAKFGVKVAAVEPGSFRSEIGTSRCKRMLSGEQKQYEFFADEMQPYIDRCRQRLAGEAPDTDPPPDAVSDAIQHALTAEAPKEHYLVVPDAFQASITIGKAFEELLHLNHDQEHSYSRDELIRLMDEEWAILRGERARGSGIPD